MHHAAKGARGSKHYRSGDIVPIVPESHARNLPGMKSWELNSEHSDIIIATGKYLQRMRNTLHDIHANSCLHVGTISSHTRFAHQQCL